MIRAVAATGKPTVVVVIGGSAITMPWLESVGAVVDAWYPGEVGGTAVADVLSGDYNPGGRLPITFAMAEGQLPLQYNHKPTGRGDDYLDRTGYPLFPFGFGLSYTTFEYCPLKLASESVDVSGDARVSLAITNTGKRRGTEIVQLYAADTASGITLPAQQLVGFARVDLDSGATKTVTFVVPLSVLAYTGASGNLIMEPGPVELSAGSSSSDIRSTATFIVTGTTRIIKGEDRAFLSEATVG